MSKERKGWEFERRWKTGPGKRCKTGPRLRVREEDHKWRDGGGGGGGGGGCVVVAAVGPVGTTVRRSCGPHLNLEHGVPE